MATPRITVTLAGGNNTGKTVFMHGMYHRLSAGLRDYFLYSVDRDEEIRLLRTWKMLQDEGEMPRATGTEPQTYTFQFAKNFTPLLQMVWTDFRGGAALEDSGPNAPKDILQWREHLPRSDSVYLVMDGGELGKWVKEGTPEYANFDSGGMDLATYNWVIREAVDGRRRLGDPPPSFVVLITKMDLLAVAADRPIDQVLTSVVANLKKLVRQLFQNGVTALVCPVQIGDFKTDDMFGRPVDRSLIRPQNLHRPICFSLWHYLTETLTARQTQLAEIEKKITEGDAELSELRAKSFQSIRRKKIAAARSAQWGWETERTGMEAEITATESQAELLMREFDRLPIIKDGDIHVSSGGSS